MADSVITGSTSRLSQFGIYRSIDARTEEFLKLSRRRQIKQGCACAVAATVITVAVVIVILLVYEYAIVESSLVQRRRDGSDNNATNDTPVADRLDRSYFGFDQDYFEQMPLLVNAMQENGLIDIFETSTFTPKLDKRGKYYRRPAPRHSYEMNSIRRTSPRPFIFEYRSPTPSPFNKKYNSRSWIEGYRNAQRMKNLETVINYLEKTINAKFGDLYSYPPTTHIAFSGVYLHPSSGDNQTPSSTSTIDLMPQSSNINQVRKDRRNHQSDPLFSFKPDSPGDVNLLADGPLKFSSVPTPSIIPMFRPGPHTKGCVGIKCGVHNLANKLNLVQGSAEIKSSDPTLFDKPSTFSVIMNLLPMTTPTPSPPGLTTLSPYDMSRIYFTTSRPEFQFRRKSTGSLQRRRPFKIRRKRPRVMEKKIGNGVVYDNTRSSERIDMADPAPASSATNMILTVKVFPKAEVPQTTTDNPPSFTSSIGILNSTQVEDFHMGSSGIIPVYIQPSTSTSLPQEIMTHTFFEPMRTTTEEPIAWPTSPPDVIKFSQEDARVPDQYQRLRELQDNSRQFFEDTNRRNSRDNYEVKEPPRTLIVKLKNEEEEGTTTEYYTEETTNREEVESMESTTKKTYVPQINGHYRNINKNSRDINNWMQESSEKRKSKLEIKSVTHRTYVPTYVEIKRMRSKGENKL